MLQIIEADKTVTVYHRITAIHNDLTVNLDPQTRVVAAFVEGDVELWRVIDGDRGVDELKNYYNFQREEVGMVNYKIMVVVE
jgi:hypothetical protein